MDLLKKDAEFIWHPYTQMKDCRKFPPILINRAKGVKLYDKQGNFYYDTISSWWCNVHGHNHPKIKSAVKKQFDALEHVVFAGFTHEPAILLAEKLISIAPGKLKKIFFSDNGSTSVEVALKMSYQYWQNTGKAKKKNFISLDYGYHGDTIGTMSVSGVDLFNKVFSPLFFESFKAPSPYCYRCPMGKDISHCGMDCVNALERLLIKRSDTICGIILEPMVLAAGGMIVYPKEYLSRAAALARKYDVHLILDEVATGFGRTGKMFACEHADNIEPDLFCLSKGITGGCLPLGATLTTKKIFNAFYADYKKKKTFFHGHTYTANPLACSAGVASLEVFREEKTLDRMKEMIPLFHRGMEKFRDLTLAGDVRYLGMLGAVELVKDKPSKKGFPFEKRIGLEVYKRGLRKNIVLRPLGNVIYLFLPLCIRKKELEEILDRTYAIIRDSDYFLNK
ncbi:MAG: adenosylmethionine--8-amino-7-oxononanoate transaminase [Candidatus Omnitrophica bacterium]|nr:adenosylmethionine--8-amino-7-oxononanoate transaminase [Candidatus Omnitrophota bacterium]MDD5552301.1 adenosylmethionine--8-amino-7-oxononanoate transaminase [Candidatus Omnitrophota bacterium]